MCVGFDGDDIATATTAAAAVVSVCSISCKRCEVSFSRRRNTSYHGLARRNSHVVGGRVQANVPFYTLADVSSDFRLLACATHVHCLHR